MFFFTCWFLLYTDKQNGDRDAIVTIKGSMRDAEDAKRQVLEVVGSQRSYENRGSHRSEGNRGPSRFDGNRDFNRSDGNRDYDSRRNMGNNFGETNRRTNDRTSTNGSQLQQSNNGTSEPMEEMIDWQAAARESVSLYYQFYAYQIGTTTSQTKSFIFCFTFI